MRSEGFWRLALCVCPGVPFFSIRVSLSFVSVWHLVVKTIASWDIHLRPDHTVLRIALCRHSCVGFQSFIFLQKNKKKNVTKYKFDYARVIIMEMETYGAIEASSKLLDSMTIGLIVSVSHHLPFVWIASLVMILLPPRWTTKPTIQRTTEPPQSTFQTTIQLRGRP